MYQRNTFPPRISEKGLLNIFFSPNVHSYLRRLSFMISFYKVRMRIKSSKCRIAATLILSILELLKSNNYKYLKFIILYVN